MPDWKAAVDMTDAGACIVCWKAGERAHLIDRSLFPDPHSDPRRTVPLCREHHTAYDDHRLDLLPYLEPRHRPELARAVEIHGLIGALERVTGQHWRPVYQQRMSGVGSIVADHVDQFGGLA